MSKSGNKEIQLTTDTATKFIRTLFEGNVYRIYNQKT